MDTPPLTTPATPAYRDRHTGLIVFGIMEIIMGGFCLLMVPLTVFGQVMTAKKNGAEFSLALATPTILIFLAMATGLIWLGIGSIQARRWARALLLCFGWLGLGIGLVSLVVVVASLGSMDELMRQQGQQLPPGAVAVAKFFTVATVLFIYVLIPGALILFYRSPHVKLTCENRDPVARWTDLCPLPVLAMCILQVYGAGCLLFIPGFGAVMPLAGFMVTGWPARLLWFGFAGFSIYAARGFYRQIPRVWLIYTVVVVGFGLSSVLTFLRVDLLEYYRTVGLPEWQIKQMAANPLMKGNFIVGLSALSMTLFVGFLLYLRRYFSQGSKPADLN